MLDRNKLTRYRQLAGLLIKYGRRDFIEAASAELGTPLEHDADGAADAPRSPEALARDLTEHGSGVREARPGALDPRTDLLSDALSRSALDAPGRRRGLRRSRRWRGSWPPSWGRGIATIFAHFDAGRRSRRPPSARCTAPGFGRDGRWSSRCSARTSAIRSCGDLDIFEDIARAIDKHTELGRRFRFAAMVEQFRKTLLEELDYRQEANNLAVIGRELEDFESLVVPKPVPELTTARVLTMDFVSGRSLSSSSVRSRGPRSTRARWRPRSASLTCIRYSSPACFTRIPIRATSCSPTTDGSHCSTSAW